MHRNRWVFSLGVALFGLAAGLLAQQAQTQRYAPGPPPTIGDIQTECVELVPAPRTRTDVGIGEQVTCWIDPSTWHDVDICIGADGIESDVSDTLGEVVWSVNGPGTVLPIVTDGSPVILTVDLAGHDTTVTVIATVTDSRALGADASIQKRKVLNVKTPGGIRILQATDQHPVEKAGDAK